MGAFSCQTPVDAPDDRWEVVGCFLAQKPAGGRKESNVCWRFQAKKTGLASIEVTSYPYQGSAGQATAPLVEVV